MNEDARRKKVTDVKNQIAVRDQEIIMLRDEIKKLEMTIRDLGEPHLLHELTLIEENNRLEEEIHRLNEKLKELIKSYKPMNEQIKSLEEKQNLNEFVIKKIRDKTILKNLIAYCAGAFTAILTALVFFYLNKEKLTFNAKKEDSELNVQINQTESKIKEPEVLLENAKEDQNKHEGTAMQNNKSDPEYSLENYIGHLRKNNEANYFLKTLKSSESIGFVYYAFSDLMSRKITQLPPIKNNKKTKLLYSFTNMKVDRSSFFNELKDLGLSYSNLCELDQELLDNKYIIIAEKNSDNTSCFNKLLKRIHDSELKISLDVTWLTEDNDNLMFLSLRAGDQALLIQEWNWASLGEHILPWLDIRSESISRITSYRIAGLANAKASPTDIWISVPTKGGTYVFQQLGLIPKELIEMGSVFAQKNNSKLSTSVNMSQQAKTYLISDAAKRFEFKLESD